MTKVALCLYGKLDGKYVNWTKKMVENKWRHTVDKIKENIIDTTDCDVYFHSFADNIEKEKPLILDTYKPVKYKMENDIDFSYIYKIHPRYNELNKDRFWENRWAAIYTMTESIKMCLNSGKEYDTIICARFDYQPNEKYDLSILDKDKLYMEDNTSKTLLKRGLAGDYMNIGPPCLVKCFVNLFDTMYDFIKLNSNPSIHIHLTNELRKGGGVIFKNIIPFPWKGRVMKYPY